MHNGKAVRGRAYPNYKHGLHSKDLPTRLRARYGELLDDPNLFNLDHDVSLARLRVSELMQSLDEVGQAKLWSDLKVACNRLEKRIKSAEFDKVRKPIESILKLVHRGADEQVKWDEIFDRQDQIRRLMDTNSKIQKEARTSIQENHYFVNLDALAEVIREHIHDRNTLTKISNAIEAKVVFGSGGKAQA